jgi:hypothetical protein
MPENPEKEHALDYVNISNLFFDPENPRLNEKASCYTQFQIFDVLEKKFDLMPIAKSMAENGYFQEEPLMVVEKAREPGEYIVVEGNRRLAALKVLVDPIFQARSPNRSVYEKLAKSLAKSLEEVPVMISKDRQTLIPRLGFRHIAGILKWESFSKAVYIHSLVQSYLQKENEYDFEKIGNELSIDSSNVKKNFLAYRIYLEAVKNGIETKRIEEDFGVWYTALSDVNIQKFIGFTPRSTEHAKYVYPIVKHKVEALAELIKYMYGTATSPKALPESRQIRELGLILCSKSSLEHLRNGGTFSDSLSLIEGEEKTLVNTLNKASLRLDESLRYMYKHKQDQKVIQAVQKCGDAFSEVLKNFPEVRTAFIEKLKAGQ